ncbi:MAG: hypothetical protein AVDCRST_MAG04-3604, partial [uncultured Acetobacteraceae bacterium]
CAPFRPCCWPGLSASAACSWRRRRPRPTAVGAAGTTTGTTPRHRPPTTVRRPIMVRPEATMVRRVATTGRDQGITARRPWCTGPRRPSTTARPAP